MTTCSVCGGGHRDPRSKADVYICNPCRRAAREAKALARQPRPVGRKDIESCDLCGQTARRKRTKHGRPYRCQACRRVEPLPRTVRPHGTIHRYRQGCKCADCRAANVAYVRAYQERYREAHGVLPSTTYRRANGYGPVYWVPVTVRHSVYERDGYVCQICTEPTDPGADPNDNRFPSLDHIVPQSKGGTHTPDNLRTAHRVCNARRGNRE